MEGLARARVYDKKVLLSLFVDVPNASEEQTCDGVLQNAFSNGLKSAIALYLVTNDSNENPILRRLCGGHDGQKRP